MKQEPPKLPTPVYSRLALFGVASVLAKDSPQCQGGEACPSQLEDDALMQLNRLGVNSEPMSSSLLVVRKAVWQQG